MGDDVGGYLAIGDVGKDESLAVLLSRSPYDGIVAKI
jgi:hypothetical protein